MSLSDQLTQDFIKLKHALETLWNEKGEAVLEKEWQLLQASDCVIKKLLDPGFKDCVDTGGNAEVGPVLYNLNHLTEFVEKFRHLLNWEERLALYAAAWTVEEFLKHRLAMPPSVLTKGDIDRVKEEGTLAGDGTLLAGDFGPKDYHTFAQFDPGWIQSALLNFVHKFDKHAFKIQKSKTPIPITPLPNSTREGVKIAVTGDWGTGLWQDGNEPKCPSQLVIDKIKTLRPDYVIHLGDVYYAGTEEQERDNLVDSWTQVFPDLLGSRLFTLNSNHEMYDGANGLYETALKSQVFQAQNEATYFALESSGFIILCLDSAFYDPSPLYMNGALYDPKEAKPLPAGAQAQLDFIRDMATQAQEKDKKLIVMCHHNPVELDGTTRVPILDGSTKTNGSLWDQVVDTIGRDPDIWYWGHVHNGIVYDKGQVLDSNTLCRCAGHGSMPFGNSCVLENLGKTLPYYAHTRMSDCGDVVERQKLRVLNGFAVLTIDGNSLTEEFYEVANNPDCNKVKWSLTS